MDENRNEDWKMDPKLKNIDAGKLDMLQKLAEKGSGKSASHCFYILPLLFRLIRNRNPVQIWRIPCGRAECYCILALFKLYTQRLLSRYIKSGA